MTRATAAKKTIRPKAAASATPAAKPAGAPRTARTPKTATAATPAARVAALASTVVGSRGRNAGAMLAAGRQSYAGVVAVLKRRLVILRDTVSELRSVATLMQQIGVRRSAAQLDGLARGALQLTLNTVHELSGLAASTQKEAFDTLARRLQDDLAEFRQLRSRPGAARP